VLPYSFAYAKNIRVYCLALPPRAMTKEAVVTVRFVADILSVITLIIHLPKIKHNHFFKACVFGAEGAYLYEWKKSK
jgi:hypothetical protein